MIKQVSEKEPENEHLHLLTVDDYREHLIGKLGELVIGLLVVWLSALCDFTLWIDYENFTDWHTDVHIADSIRFSVAKAAEKGSLIRRKQFLDIL